MVILFEGKGPVGFMPTGQVMVLGCRQSGLKSREEALGRDNDNLAHKGKRQFCRTTQQTRTGFRARNRN
jgi:hypothetical protein